MEPLEASSSIAKKHGTHNKDGGTSYSKALQQKLSIKGQRINQKKPSLKHPCTPVQHRKVYTEQYYEAKKPKAI